MGGPFEFHERIAFKSNQINVAIYDSESGKHPARRRFAALT